MADAKDTRGFFRKVVDFVVNPGTEWGESGKPAEPAQESEFAKSELKAMIERKRRNDFVRKRELDTLRKLRRQGLTSEQLAALGSSSAMADTEGRLGDNELPAAPGMKAKIDEIEQQMAGHAIPDASRRTTAAAQAPRQLPAEAPANEPALQVTELSRDAQAMADTVFDGLRPDAGGHGLALGPLPGAAQDTRKATAAPGVAAPVATGVARPGPPDSVAQIEVQEAVHDPDLDEAVMAYANGDNEQVEQLLMALIRQGGARAQHAETWMVMFDLYRATGQQSKFEAIAGEFAERFGRSAPQWFSVPRLIAEASTPVRTKASRIDGRLAWACPERLDEAAVLRLRDKTQLLPLPWVFDWSALHQVEVQAVVPLLTLLQHWAPQPLDMRWIGGDQLLAVLAEAAPIGVRDADPLWWQLHLQVLRLFNRPARFDEVAIDYCVTYEVSPPSWESTACQVRVSGSRGGPATNVAPTTIIGEASTSFVESQLLDEPGPVQMVRLELSGQLVGDIGEVLRQLDAKLGTATLVEVSCARLLRVDFMASGDLLNWVLGYGREGRSVSFTETNRLVALFFSAVGIDEHAGVKVRMV